MGCHSTDLVDRVEAEPPAGDVRAFHCSGCGRRLLQYVADTLGRDAVIQVRCRDCKTTSQLRGADVAALLQALSHGPGGG